MCTTDGPGMVLGVVTVYAAILGGLPLALAWNARTGRRGAAAAVVVCVLALAAVTFALRPSGALPPRSPIREALGDAMAYGLTWVYLALALAWGLVAWRPSGAAARIALVLTVAPLGVVAAWGLYEAFGPNVCDEIMRAPQ